MHDFVAHVLRRYYAQTDWNPYNSYLYLTSSSQAVLDFAIPSGLSLSISASPSPPFFATYRLRALPQLTGALGYIYASIEDKKHRPLALDLGGSSRDVNLKDFVERFRIIEAPRQGFIANDYATKDDVVKSRRDYLLYGCMHIPSARVDALVTTRLSPTWQLLATAISTPPRNAFGLASNATSLSSSSSGAQNPGGLSEKPSDANLNATAAAAAGPPPGATNLQFNLQQDTGRWFTEYSYSVDDGLLGFRVLHNLGHVAGHSLDSALPSSSAPSGSASDVRGSSVQRRIDDDAGHETSVGGGLQGRFSVGAELFVSPLEKSAGLSTGMRFTTLPEGTSPSSAALGTATQNVTAMVARDDASQQYNPSQTPTTITATLNPMMGHLCTAYAARMARDIVACSRFDFNVYSYESELTLGAEYWLRGNKPLLFSLSGSERNDDAEDGNDVQLRFAESDRDRKLTAREQKGVSLRDGPVHQQPQRTTSWSLRDAEAKQDGIAVPREQPSMPMPSGAVTSTLQANKSSPFGADVGKSKKKRANATAAKVEASESQPNPLAEAPRNTTLGVLKARISTTGIVAFMWCGRLRNCLVSIGLRGDVSASSLAGAHATGTTRGFTGPGKPLRGVGIDVIYFSQNGQ